MGTAKQEDIRMISVVLNTKTNRKDPEASQELLTYGFRNFKIKDFIDAGEVVENLNVKMATCQVPLVANDDISLVIPVSKKILK